MLFLKHLRASRLADHQQTAEAREWWSRQRLHGLCQAFRQECAVQELRYLSQRLQTAGGITKLKRPLQAAIPKEYRTVT